MVEIRRAAPDDAERVVQAIRPIDAQEIRALGYTDLTQALRTGIATSAVCWCADDADGAVAVFGVAPHGPLLSEIGVPWLIGTTRMRAHRRSLARLAQPYIRRMHDLYPALFNAALADNVATLAWLQRVGFTLREPVTHNGHRFVPFLMER